MSLLPAATLTSEEAIGIGEAFLVLSGITGRGHGGVTSSRRLTLVALAIPLETLVALADEFTARSSDTLGIRSTTASSTRVTFVVAFSGLLGFLTDFCKILYRLNHGVSFWMRIKQNFAA